MLVDIVYALDLMCDQCEEVVTFHMQAESSFLAEAKLPKIAKKAGWHFIINDDDSVKHYCNDDCLSEAAIDYQY